MNQRTRFAAFGTLVMVFLFCQAARALPGPYLAVPPFYVKAFPEYLRAAGYYTTNRVKTDCQFGTPFTIWDEVTQTAHWRNRSSGAITATACRARSARCTTRAFAFR